MCYRYCCVCSGSAAARKSKKGKIAAAKCGPAKGGEYTTGESLYILSINLSITSFMSRLLRMFISIHIHTYIQTCIHAYIHTYSTVKGGLHTIPVPVCMYTCNSACFTSRCTDFEIAQQQQLQYMRTSAAAAATFNNTSAARCSNIKPLAQPLAQPLHYNVHCAHVLCVM
jgi:hypothetical protein